MTPALLLALALGADTPDSPSEPPSTDWSLSRMMEDVTGAPREREASGTGWQPATTPMHAHHLHAAGWMVMLHYSVFAGVDSQLSQRGATLPVSANWVMAMADHSLLGGRFSARTMLTLEPLTAGGQGFPLLLQSGETYNNQPLHDFQHPHDLFMELAVSYQHALPAGLAFELYAAPSGEPALGPPAFMHRLSASSDPLPPLGHHWQDSTHVSFGVLTAGLFNRWAKLEGSWFNGREPDEFRWDFDWAPFDSWSARLSLQPLDWLSAQVSHGFLQQPEALYPLNRIQRTTASLMVVQHPLKYATVAVTGSWGHNVGSQERPSNSFLLEANVECARNDLFLRAEAVQKFGHDLVLQFDPQLAFERLWVGALSLGYLRELFTLGPVVIGAGGRIAVDLIPAELVPYYGTSFPLGGMAYLRLRPTLLPGEERRLGLAGDRP
ncbi:MAG TPA: hypothetical protein VFA20_28890 [Myxococcaceae bacterium]|nr:hypothetical protein [Myxococcaceae bacterium]